MDDRVTEAADLLRFEHRYSVDTADGSLRLVDPVKGDVGNAVLRVLGLVERFAPVGAAAHGPSGVAIGVWCGPELYLARWTNGRRWVVGYRLAGGSGPNGYVRTEGRIPTRLEIGTWYGAVPDDVAETFLEAGLLVDDPPFPVPPAPPAPPPPERARPAAASPRTPRPRSAAAAKKPPAPRQPARDAVRVCPGCSMQKQPTQFVPGSDLCVDCR